VNDTQLSDESLLRTASVPLEGRIVSPGGFVLPSSDSTGAIGAFDLPGDGSSRGPRPSSLLAHGDETALDEADFYLDAEGEIYEHNSQAGRSGTVPLVPSDAAASARVRQEHESGQRGVSIVLVC
jgi:meiotic recombination protein REC8